MIMTSQASPSSRLQPHGVRMRRVGMSNQGRKRRRGACAQVEGGNVLGDLVGLPVLVRKKKKKKKRRRRRRRRKLISL